MPNMSLLDQNNLMISTENKMKINDISNEVIKNHLRYSAWTTLSYWESLLYLNVSLFLGATKFLKYQFRETMKWTELSRDC